MKKNNIDSVLMNSQEQSQNGYDFDPMIGQYIGPANQQPKYGMNCNPNPVAPSMAWFKFIIYFQLFASAFLNLCVAMSYLTGALQGEYAEMVYAYFGPSLRICDICFGVLYILFVAYILFTRFALAKYKKYGPACYLGVWGVNAVVPVLYLVALTILFPEIELVWTNCIIGVISSMIWVLINYFYFKKRRDLFVGVEVVQSPSMNYGAVSSEQQTPKSPINAISIVLFVIQVVAVFGAIVGNGSLIPENRSGIQVVAFLIGFFLPTIIGIILQIITLAKRKR